MSNIKPLKEVLTDATIAYDAYRDAEILRKVGAHTLISALKAEDDNPLLAFGLDDDVQTHSGLADEYDVQARKLFGNIQGFYLGWVEPNSVSLTSHPRAYAVRGPLLNHTSLTAEINADGELDIQRVAHEGAERTHLPKTEADQRIIAETLERIEQVKNQLSK